MKNIAKNFLLSILLVSLVLAMASCNLGSLMGGGEATNTNAPQQGDNEQKETTPEPEGTTAPEEIPNPEDDPDVKAEFCKELAVLNKNKHSKVELLVTTTVNGVALNSEFVLNEREVDYTIEQLASFEVDENGNIIIPESFKKTLTGSVTLGDKNDTIIFDGEILIVSDYNVLVGAFNFNADNVGQYNKKDGEITTVMFEVDDIADFLGVKVEGAENMTVTVSYSQKAISTIVIKYATATASVALSYTFG